MPHLSFEYSQGLGDLTDLDAFAAACRDALLATGACPLGGIRVRGFEADVQAVADGGRYHFCDMVLRLGQGRDAATRGRIADELLFAQAAECLSVAVVTCGIRVETDRKLITRRDVTGQQ